MAIEYFCKGCGRCRIDNGEDIEDGLCPHCQQRRDFPPPKKPYDRMTKSTEHWLIATVLVLLAETSPATGHAWIQWALIAGAAAELGLALFRWKHWPWSREPK